MKKLFFTIALLGSLFVAQAQDTLMAVIVTDTLPAIQIKKNIPAFVGGIMLTGGMGILLVSANNYIVSDKLYWRPVKLKPYLIATQDSTIMSLYKQHRQQYRRWLISGSTSVVLAGVSLNLMADRFIMKLKNQTTDVVSGTWTIVALATGGAFVVYAIIQRAFAFKNLREAINIYNAKYSQKPRVSLRLSPASSSLGVGLSLRF